MTKTAYMGPATADHPNGQPVEKLQREYDGTLDIHSIFYTIQGEGPFCGHPAVFIRLAGCNLQCPWCDTEYTLGRERMDIPTIMTRVLKLAGPRTLVVITGGEPFRQPLAELLESLVAARYFVQVETNGTLPPAHIAAALYNQNISDRSGVYVVCSPKTGVIHSRLHEVACCYKYVMDSGNVDPDDGLPVTALGHTANPRLGRPPEGTRKPVYLQPADHQDEGANAHNMKAVIESAMRYGYVVQLQIHKILNME